MTFQINANKRADYFNKIISEISSERITDIALPFLSLNARAAKASSLGIGAYQAFTIIKKGEWVNRQKLGVLAFIVSNTAFTLLFPAYHFFISNAAGVAVKTSELSAHLWKHEWKKSGMASLSVAHQAVYIASIFYATPEWIALSLVAQIFVELYQSVEFASQGKKPEALSRVILAGIRAYYVQEPLKTLHRNYLGEKLTQQTAGALFAELEDLRGAGKTIDVEAHLIQRGISSHIQGLEFKNFELYRYVFKNMRFYNCKFSYGEFYGVQLYNVSAKRCDFKGTTWIYSIIQNSLFDNCGFKDTAFIASFLGNVTIKNSDLTQVCFNDSILLNFSILRGTLLETSFLNARVVNGVLKDCDLTDALLLDAEKDFKIQGGTPHRITRPIIAIGWNFEARGVFNAQMYDSLRDNQAIPLRYEHEYRGIDPYKLFWEVFISSLNLEMKGSISQEILGKAKEGSLIFKIQERAASILKHCDGLLVPGGEDIQPVFYQKPTTYYYSDMRRTVMELSLISLAHQASKPIMGICRGAQMINIYFGGTLHQHVEGQRGFALMEHTDSPAGQWLKEISKGELYGFSAHHQAADKIGQDLEVVLKVGDIPKMLVNKKGDIIASQIHPEIYGWMPKEEFMEEWPSIPLPPDTIEKNRSIYQHFISIVKRSGMV